MHQVLTYLLALLEDVEVHGRRNVKHLAMAMEKIDELRAAFAPPAHEKEGSDDPLADQTNS